MTAEDALRVAGLMGWQHTPRLMERLVEEEALPAPGSHERFVPAPDGRPGLGPAGPAPFRDGCIPGDRLRWCDGREHRSGDMAACPRSSQ